jgi:1-deoxy-D-xylulose-5-phosphate synthase
MQRAFDQVVHDVAIQKLPVVFCLDRAGLVGEDGPTHHGAYDIAYFRCIPNMIISAPMNEAELRNLMYTAQLESTTLPFVIRYPRGEGVMSDLKAEGVYPAHYDMRFAKPLDEALLHEALEKYQFIVTVEDGTVVGGFGSAVAEFITHHGYKNNLRMLGIPDRVVEHGTLKELHRECNYDAQAIIATIREMMNAEDRISILQ